VPALTRFRIAAAIFALGLLAGLLAAVPSASASILSGTAAGDRFGWSVSWAGDVNQDGFDDFLVGIPHRDTTGQNAGQVLLYLGQEDAFPSDPAFTISGEAAGDEFGFATSTAGDLNQDGYDDFLVGAPGKNTAGLNAGRVYLFLGGASPNGVADKTWDGDMAQARFGASLAGGFDFDQDQRSDFAVGAPGHTAAGVNAGQVRIYLGAAVDLAVEKYTLNADQANWALGRSLDPAGDVNGDGFADLVAGAPQPFDVNSGRAVIWFGQPSGSSNPTRLLLSGETGADRFGWDVSRAGDVNQDGFDDVLVGAPSVGADNGAAYLFRGGTSMNTVFDWRAVGSAAGDRFGAALDGGFDLSGDGVPDLAVGAPGASSLASDAGQAHLFRGQATPAAQADTTFLPAPPVASFEAGDEFGSSVRFVGSLDGHEAGELAVGAPLGNAAAGPEAGYVNLFTHPPEVTPVRLLVFAASPVPEGVRLTWELTDADELAGLRVEADFEGLTRPVTEGWLSPSTRSVLDPVGGEWLYRLIGLDRVGGSLMLGEMRWAGRGPGLGVSGPDRNPFRDRLRFTLSGSPGPGAVTVWDIRGRPVRRLWSGDLAAGPREVIWDGRDDAGARVAPGLYLIRILHGGATTSFKVIRLP
jgi:hypothetical protein